MNQDRRTRQVGTVTALTTEGRPYTLHQYVEEVAAGGAWVAGMPWLETAAGSEVDVLARGRYEVMATGLLLSADDAAAP